MVATGTVSGILIEGPRSRFRISSNCSEVRKVSGLEYIEQVVLVVCANGAPSS